MQLAGRWPSVALSLLFTVAALPSVARAQTLPPPSSPPASASALPAAPGSSTAAAEARRTTLFELGVAAAAANRWEEACERFRATLDIRSSPKVLFTLAEAEEHLGRFASAQASYVRAVEGARLVPGEADVVRAALAALHAIEPRVPHLRVTTPGVAAATITLDGHPVAAGARLALDPGTHEVAARSTGYRVATMSVAVGVGGELDVPVRLDPDGPPPTVLAAPLEPVRPPVAPRRAAATREPSALAIVGLAGAAAGVIALGIGTYFAFEAKGKNDNSYTAGCTENLCPSGGLALRQDALSAARAATGTIVAGGALVAAGLTVWWLAPSSSRPPTVGLRSSALGTTGGSLALVGTWP